MQASCASDTICWQMCRRRFATTTYFLAAPVGIGAVPPKILKFKKPRSHHYVLQVPISTELEPALKTSHRSGFVFELCSEHTSGVGEHGPLDLGQAKGKPV